MSPESFIAWLDEMTSSGRAKSDAECARLLGRTPHNIVTMKKRGADRMTALACTALLADLAPYGEKESDR